MGLNQIRDKLNNELQLFTSTEYSLTEKDVVYLFVESRKILEQENDFNKFPSIKFYADWIVHSEKSHAPKIIESMLKAFDSKKIDEFISMEYLRDELRVFIQVHNLYANVLEEKYWKPIWFKLINILSDQPLVLDLGVEHFVFRATEGGDVSYEATHT